MEKKLTFNQEHLMSYLKVSKEFISQLKSHQEEDIIWNQLVVSLEATMLSSLAEERILTYYCPRPKFFDWLLRREKRVDWELKIKDLMLNPPPPDTKRIYLTDVI